MIGVVRPQVVDRDGYCRLKRSYAPLTFGACLGSSEWSHYNATHRRSKTRGMAPEERHDRRHSLMLCSYHSREYDENRMDIEELDAVVGCDGRLRYTKDGESWTEPERES